MRNHLFLLCLYSITGFILVFGQDDRIVWEPEFSNIEVDKQLSDFKTQLELLRQSVNNISSMWEKLNGSSSTLKTFKEVVNDHSFTFCYLLNEYLNESNNFKSKDTKDNHITNCINLIKGREFTKAVEEFNLIDSVKINFIVKEVYDYQIANFDLLMEFASHLTDKEKYCKILFALNDEMKANDHKDMSKLIVLRNSMTVKCLFGKFVDVFANVTDEIDVKISDNFEEKLKNVILDKPVHIGDKEILEINEKLYDYNIVLYESTTKQTLKNIYDTVDIQNILNTISKFKSLQEQMYACRALYEIMKSKGHLSDQRIFPFAKKIKELLENPSYETVKPFDLNTIKNELPLQVRHAIFSPKICLKNVHHSEYIYAPLDDLSYDDKRRNVFSWIEDYKFEQGYYILELTEDNKWYIKSDYFKEYMYIEDIKMDSENRYVFTRIGKNKKDTDNYKWIIEVDGDYSYIKNVEYNEYLYLPGAIGSSFGKYDNERRRTFTWIKGDKHANSQWKIESC